MSIRVKSEKDLYLYLNEIYIMGISMRDIDVTTLSQLGYNVYESFGFIEINETALKTNLKNLSEVHRLACDSMICCCIDGELTLEINERTFTIQSGMFIILKRNNTWKVLQYSKDLYIICLLSQNSDYIAQLNNTLLLLDFKFQIDKNPCYRLQGTILNELITLFHLMKEVMKRNATMLKKEIIQNYLCIIFYTILSETVQNIYGTHSNKYANEMLRKFILLLDEHCKRERKLSFYADRLCVTSKYLTVLIKQASGRNARQWIVDFVIAESKRLLQKRSLNVLEVSDMMNFPNQSFFTKFFRQHTGQTPTEYKQIINA